MKYSINNRRYFWDPRWPSIFTPINLLYKFHLAFAYSENTNSRLKYLTSIFWLPVPKFKQSAIMDLMAIFLLFLKFIAVNLPKSPPDVEAHGIQPKEGGQKPKVHYDSCNKKL